MTGPQELREAFVAGWEAKESNMGPYGKVAEALRRHPDPPQAVMAGGNPVETRSFPGATFHRDQTERLAKPTPQASEGCGPVEPVKEQ
jgi:hypothetical protein